MVNRVLPVAPGVAGAFATALLLTACDSTAPFVPDRIDGISPGAQTAEVGTPVPVAPAVRVRHQGGGGLGGVEVTFEITTGDGTLANTTVVTNPDGVASAGQWTLGTSPGASEVTATARGLPAVTFTAAAAPGPPETLTVSLDRETFGLGETVEVEVRVEDRYGNPTAGEPSFLSEEVRWLHEYPVLDPTPPGTHRFLAAAPGRAELQATLDDLRSDTLGLEVIPSQPTVLGVIAPSTVTPSDTVVLRGFRMDDLMGEEVTIEGDPVQVLEADSASLHLLLPAADGGQCRGAAIATIETAHAVVHGPLEIRRARVDEVDLAPGELLHLSPIHQECLRLVPHAGASYAVALVDNRAIERARFEAEPRFGYPDLRSDDPADFYSLWLEDRSLPSPPVAAPASGTFDPPSDTLIGDTHLLTPPAAGQVVGFRAQDGPWQTGDRTTVVVYSSQTRSYTDTPATIVRTYGNRYAVALLDRDLSLQGAGWLGAMDQAMADFLETGESLFQNSLRDGRPTTAGSGQLLMVIGAGVGSFAFNEGTSNWVQVSIPGHGQSISRFVVYHEIAHAWQFRYMQARVDGSPWEFTNWAMEGGANVLAREAQREIAGQSFFDNLPISQVFGGFGLSLTTFPQDDRGAGAIWDFNRGYGGSEWLMRDLIYRLMSEGGLSLEGALREVSQGSLDGWFGHSSPEGQGDGLEQRMSSYLGTAWEPADAILLALASIAVDDVVDSELLQVPYAYRVFEHHRPAGELRAGQGARLSRVAGDATAAGYFRIEGEGRGGSYRMGAEVDGLEWLLVRKR